MSLTIEGLELSFIRIKPLTCLCAEDIISVPLISQCSSVKDNEVCTSIPADSCLDYYLTASIVVLFSSVCCMDLFPGLRYTLACLSFCIVDSSKKFRGRGLTESPSCSIQHSPCPNQLKLAVNSIQRNPYVWSSRS